MTATAAAEARTAARRLQIGCPARSDIAQSVAACGSLTRRGPSGRPLTRRGPPGGPLTGTRPLRRPVSRTSTRPARRQLPCAGPPAAARTRPSAIKPAARAQHLVAATAAEIHPIVHAAADVVVAEPLSDVGIAVADAMPVFRPVLPVVAAERIHLGTVDVDVVDVAVPVDAAAPVVATGAPAAQRPAGAEGEPGRDEAGADVARISPVVWGISRIGPSAVHHAGIVIGHVDRVRIGLLDRDPLLAALSLGLRDRLLLGRRQLVVGLGLRAQPLDRVHHVRLLGQNRIAEFERPVELRAHHRDDVGRGRERLHASVPRLQLGRRAQRVALQVLVFLDPAVRLNDLERIGRRHDDERQEAVRVQGDGRDQRFELFRLQELRG